MIKYAFDLARKRHQKVSSVDKANVLSDIYGFWREVLLDVAKGYPEVKYDFNFVDAITHVVCQEPGVVRCSRRPNMFGDIITDLGAKDPGRPGPGPVEPTNPEGTSMSAHTWLCSQVQGPEYGQPPGHYLGGGSAARASLPAGGCRGYSLSHRAEPILKAV